jgi:hypothetical protein
VTELARCNGTIVVEDGQTIGIVEKGGGWIGTALFVSALVGSIATIAGGVIIVTAGVVGVIPATIGVLALGLTVAFYKKKQRDKQALLPAPWLVLDRGAGIVTDGRGTRICSLAEARLERVFQAGSSSKALALMCPKKIIVARGTPFGDEVDAVEQALRRVLA